MTMSMTITHDYNGDDDHNTAAAAADDDDDSRRHQHYFHHLHWDVDDVNDDNYIRIII